MEVTDSALVELCLLGRKEAYGGLVRRYQDRVFQFCLRYTKGNRNTAEDIAQECFIKAYYKLNLFDADRNFLNWLLSICVNIAKNQFRSEARMREVHDNHTEILQISSESIGASWEDLDKVLARIPENLRIPLVLRHVEGLAYSEIASVLKIRISAAKMRVKRGRDEFVRLLEVTERKDT